jgi:uncharacterized protein YuzE
LITLALASLIVPLFCEGFISYEIFINSAFTRAYLESIVIGVIGAIMLVIAMLVWSRRPALVIVCFFTGLSAVTVSGALLLIISQPWLGSGIGQQWQALVPLSFALAGAVAFNVRRRRMVGQQQAGGAKANINPYLALVPVLKGLRQHSLWSHYDPDTDTLAIHFGEPDAPNVATDSAMTDDDIIVRHNDAGEVIGLTILHASARKAL